MKLLRRSSNLLRSRFINVYFAISFGLFLFSFIFSQHVNSIESISISQPIAFFLAGVSDWQSYNEIYFNSKVLMLKYTDYWIGFLNPGKICGNEYCFRFSMEQQNFYDAMWYPSAVGLDADLFHLIYGSMVAANLPGAFVFFLIYCFYYLMSALLIFLMYRVFIETIEVQKFKTLLQVILFSPWIMLSSMSTNFSLGLRFFPILVYLFIYRYKQNLVNAPSRKLTFFLGLSCLFSSLHGYEFTPFLLALSLAMPVSVAWKRKDWILLWFKSFFLGLMLSIILWATVIYINTQRLDLAIRIPLHTLLKHLTVSETQAPEFAVDSGGVDATIMESLNRFVFQTSFLFPHPFPSQVWEVLHLGPWVEVALYASTSLFVIFLIIGVGFITRRSWSSLNLLLGLAIMLITAFVLHDYTFYHRQFLGSVIAISALIGIGTIFNSDKSTSLKADKN